MCLCDSFTFSCVVSLSSQCQWMVSKSVRYASVKAVVFYKGVDSLLYFFACFMKTKPDKGGTHHTVAVINSALKKCLKRVPHMRTRNDARRVKPYTSVLALA